MEDLLGIRNADGVRMSEPGCTYMRFEVENPLANSGSGGVVAGFTTGIRHCTYQSDCTVRACAYEPMKGRYSAFNEDCYPCITQRQVGKGTVVYIAGGIGQTYLDYKIPEHRDAVAELVRSLTPSKLKISNAFPTVEVEMRLKQGKPIALIHFVNHTGYMQRPIEQFMPNPGIQVSMQIAQPVCGVHALFHSKEIPFEQADGALRFSVDLEDYELVAVEWQE